MDLLKVFIAEDESIVREGLRDMIPWEKYGFEFVGDAPDGTPVAMVHCNNCTSDINAWVELLGEAADAVRRRGRAGIGDGDCRRGRPLRNGAAGGLYAVESRG